MTNLIYPISTKTRKQNSLQLLAITLLLIAGIIASVNAQNVSTYVFTQSSGTYTAIGSGTSALGASIDDASGSVQNIGFNFSYHGTVFTQFIAQSNGYICLGSSISQNYTPLSGVANCIAFGGGDGRSGTSGIYYAVSGSAPNRVLTIEEPSYFITYQQNNDHVNVQIKLFETSNVIQIIYGSPAATTSWSRQVGLTGAAVSDFSVRTNTSNWSATTAASTNATFMSWSSSTFPASGQTYTWTPPVVCSGQPTGGTTVSTANPACAGVSFTLSLSGATQGTGLTYQWQSSPTNSGYTNISGATASTLTTSQTTATYYQCIITCTASALSATSTPLQLTMNSPTNCYCTPTHSTGTSGCFYGVISNVTINTLNSSPACISSSPYYALNAATGTNTTSLVGGATYTLSITSGFYDVVGVWIDYNQSGTFDASEYIAISPQSISTNANFTGTASVTIPGSMVAGLTRMRINTEYYCCYTTMSATAACSAFTYGETEDYWVTLVTPIPCSGTPTAGTAAASVTQICTSGTSKITLTDNYFGYSGISYQWDSAATSGGPYYPVTGGTGGTTKIDTSGSLTANTYYVCVTTCANSGLSAQSNEAAVLINPAINAGVVYPYPYTTAFCGTGGTATCTAGSSDANYVYVWNTGVTASSITPTVSNTTNYAVSATDQGFTCSSAVSVSVYSFPAVTPTATPSSFCNGSNTTSTLASGVSATNFSVSSIAYAPIAVPGSGVTTLATGGVATPALTSGSLDDGYWSGQPIGFNFNYFGTVYNTMSIGTNGVVEIGNGAMSTQFTFSNFPSASNPCNVIAVDAQDLYLTSTGTLRYWVNGVAPNRVCVVQYFQVPGYTTVGAQTVELMLYETIGNIEIHVTQITDNTHSKTIGLQNCAGTIGAAAPGRNNVNFQVTTPEAWRFIPPVTFSFDWEPSSNLVGANNTASVTTVSNLPVGTNTYTVLITNPTSLCSQSFYDTVTVYDIPNPPTVTPVSPTVCGDQSTALSATPASGNVIKWWDSPSGGTLLLQGSTFNTPVASGTVIYYSEEVSPACASATRTSVTVNWIAPPVVALGTTSGGAICAGASTSLTAASSNDPNYTYVWNPGNLTGASVNVSPASTTTYTLTAVDHSSGSNAGCATTMTDAVGVNPLPYVTVSPSTPTICAGSSISLTANGGSTVLPTGYCASGLYSSGCGFPDIITNVTLGSSLINRTSTCDQGGILGYSIYSSPNPILIPGNTYTISITTGGDVEGAAAYIDYDQSGDFTGLNETVLSPSYAGTVPATYTGSFTVPLNALPGLTLFRARCTYNSAPASACAAVTYGEIEDYYVTIGGSGSGTYAWSPSSSLSSSTGSVVTATSPATTTYTVVTTDNNGCTNSATATISVILPPTVTVSNSVNVTCNGGSNGAITASVSSGSGPFTYTWSDGTVSSGNSTSNTLGSLTAGTYSVTITSGNGCTASITNITVIQPSVLLPNLVINNVSCNGGSNGSILSSPTGGTSGYTYVWSNGAISSSISGLNTNLYALTVTDSRGCTVVSQTTLTQPTVLSTSGSSASSVSCNGGSNGTATVSASGGTPPYNGTGTRTGLTAGTYNFIVTDSHGCTATTSAVTITQPSAIAASSSVVSNVSCPGGSNGSASVSASGGTAPYSGTGTFSGLTAGSYTYIVTDNNGCTGSTTVVINQPPAINISLGSNTPVCVGSPINLSSSATGGTGAFRYAWTGPNSYSATGANNSIASATTLNTGSYLLTVTDANGCSATATTTVSVYNCQTLVNLVLYSQGYYLGSGTMQPVLFNEGVCPTCFTQTDTIIVDLHNTTSPYGMVESVQTLLMVDGSATAIFSPAIAGHSYYIAIRHRNMIQTWSKLPYAFTATGSAYNFSTAATQAFGNNMILVDVSPDVWAFYTGDINNGPQDQNIDLIDFPNLDFGINHGLFGYYASDLNGDGNVDLLDFPILDANINAGIFSQHPQ